MYESLKWKPTYKHFQCKVLTQVPKYIVDALCVWMSHHSLNWPLRFLILLGRPYQQEEAQLTYVNVDFLITLPCNFIMYILRVNQKVLGQIALMVPCLRVTNKSWRVSLGFRCWCVFIFTWTKNLLSLFPTYVHIHLFAPSTLANSSNRNKLKKELKIISIFFCLEIKQNSFPP